MLGDWIIETKDFFENIGITFKNIGIAFKNTARENTCLHDYEEKEPQNSIEFHLTWSGEWKAKEEHQCKKCGRVKRK